MWKTQQQLSTKLANYSRRLFHQLFPVGKLVFDVWTIDKRELCSIHVIYVTAHAHFGNCRVVIWRAKAWVRQLFRVYQLNFVVRRPLLSHSKRHWVTVALQTSTLGKRIQKFNNYLEGMISPKRNYYTHYKFLGSSSWWRRILCMPPQASAYTLRAWNRCSRSSVVQSLIPSHLPKKGER